jgi:peroxiredoxin
LRTKALSSAFAATPFKKSLVAVSHALLACSLLSASVIAATPPPAAPRPGSPAPDFTLTDAAGKSHTLSAYKGKWVVLEWVNYDCPFVKKHYGSGNMQKLQKAARDKGAVWLSINSSAPGKQGHFEGKALAARIAKETAAMDAYLLDADGKTGRLYKAKTTPHMFVIDPEGVIAYAGAIDDKPSTDKDDIAGAVNYVQAALDAGLAGEPVETASTTPYGCGVKYGDK